MKIVFMGTPDFAVGALQAIIDAGHEVAAVVTQPDKPKGRGKEMQYPPVKQCAVAAGIPVFQPTKIKAPDAVEILRSYQADIFVVAAFGQILSQEILDMPRLGCINIHASLLPKYRGAAPIQWAIIDGEKETGVTIMQMDAGLDTGDMLLKKIVPITARDTGESLFDKLMQAGAELIVEALPKIEAGELVPEKQREEDTCYAKMLTKQLGHINWSEPAVVIERLIRGLNSWPSAYTLYNGKTLKIWEAEVVNSEELRDFQSDMSKISKMTGMSEISESSKDDIKEPGMIQSVTKDAFYVSTGNGILKIQSVQLEGKKRMRVHDFLL
ncbi:MAG: methionyl-tRNA formyltransferase, partial [Lachnospiraceae bacterium]|nr:methionyl-tRNA formyltransferase [Lachnospiraceae bacterium]